MFDDDLATAPILLDEEVPAEPIAPLPLRLGGPRAGGRLAPRGRRRARVGPRLPSAPALFPWLARRFAPGEATIWVGANAAVDPVLETLYAGSALANGRISLVEGANRFHPYRIGERGRALGLPAETTLRRIRLARAFTAYQMVALVDGWAADARRHPPTLLVGHDLPALFGDVEIAPPERAGLLGRLARGLGRLLREVPVPLLLTFPAGGLDRFPALATEGPRWSDVVAFDRGPRSLRARALRDGARLALVPRAGAQTGLDEFDGPVTAEEVIAWDAPPPRTARRSRSG